MPRTPTESAESVEKDEEFATRFEITCSCGQSHSGQRRRRHQQIICKECGAALFVLPIDVYPKPTASKGKKRKGKRSGAIGGPVAEAMRRLSNALGERAARTGASLAAAWRWLTTPVKLAVYAVLFIVSATGWYLQHRATLARAEVSIVADAEVGFAALKEREFAVAADHLGKAADAARILKRADEPSRRIIQASRESAVLAQLASSSLLVLLEEVDDGGVEEDLSWKLAQQIGFRDQWVAFDATVEKRKDKVAIALPLKAADRKIVIRVDSPVFDKVPLDDGPIDIVFAGQIGNVRRLAEAWDVTLSPESIFLWESFELYGELGFPLDEIWNTEAAVTQRLQAQRIWQGGTDEVDALAEDEAADAESAGDGSANDDAKVGLQ